ncbi:MAG: tryptophan--tRNA ligase [Bacteroidota bacterium]|nr:tryptophan--tRNA ligase [Bacteroidota bacterium]MDP4234520.1 tryptophan--tRNA ligase [Bacteroidota bacterium]MDP4242585.1 tryptophan--tRNA ligase [Bacteroidota bacterium]MDP4289389.1 tryptophan--tRNA ligase [Bacteroidota bacterium]
MKRRVFSGIQPSEVIHIGNYIGAVKRWVALQDDPAKDNIYCVVDLHALTVKQDPEVLRERTLELMALFLAVGLNPEKSTLFVQSHVSVHAEGGWLLNCITPLGWLNKMTQFKDKSQKQETILAGLLDYPVLMASDILFYDTHEVPVGEDQKQHVELARNIAERFNFHYGETFIVPEPVIAKAGARIMGLDDPTMKMSKSMAHIQGHAIRLLDEPKQIERAIMRSKTDSGSEIRFSNEPEKAGVNNLLTIYQVLTAKTRDEVEQDFASARGYGDLKKRVAEVVIAEAEPVRKRFAEIATDRGELERIMRSGAEKARAISGPRLADVKRKMGLVV